MSRAKPLFVRHSATHAVECGLDRYANGKLLQAAAHHHFDAVVTIDKNIRFQQNLQTMPVRVLEINVLMNRFEDIVAVSPHFPRAIELLAKFAFVSVRADSHTVTLVPRP